jgi:ankyrin repeat protein
VDDTHFALGMIDTSYFSGGQTAWHVAARHGHSSVLKAMASVLRTLSSSQLKLLSKLGKTPDVILDRLVNDYDSKALTPLHLACIYNHAEAAGFLMECTANPFIIVSG